MQKHSDTAIIVKNHDKGGFIMKKAFLFLNLFFVLFVLVAGESFAAKKYRYIKREHGLRFQGNIPMSLQPFNLSANLSGAYAYNWKGMLEAGPYFNLAFANKSVTDWSGGLLIEYNFIKNRGKRKLIPSLGLSVGAAQGLLFDIGAHASLKSFVAKRTAFITTLGYNLHTPFNAMFRGGITHNVDISMGFSYYFDFY